MKHTNKETHHQIDEKRKNKKKSNKYKHEQTNTKQTHK